MKPQPGEETGRQGPAEKLAGEGHGGEQKEEKGDEDGAEAEPENGEARHEEFGDDQDHAESEPVPVEKGEAHGRLLAIEGKSGVSRGDRSLVAVAFDQ